MCAAAANSGEDSVRTVRFGHRSVRTVQNEQSELNPLRSHVRRRSWLRRRTWLRRGFSSDCSFWTVRTDLCPKRTVRTESSPELAAAAHMASERIQFGLFVLDIGRYELTRAGKPVRMERIPMDLLILLVRENGRLIGRKEIIERLWGKDVYFATDNSINTAIRKIRRVLAEDPEKPHHIEPVRGTGYSFKAG